MDSTNNSISAGESGVVFILLSNLISKRMKMEMKFSNQILLFHICCYDVYCIIYIVCYDNISW